MTNEQMADDERKEAIEQVIETMLRLGKEEGEKFRQEHGREPTQQETERIADMIMRQAQTALVICKGGSQ